MRLVVIQTPVKPVTQCPRANECGMVLPVMLRRNER